MLWPNLLFDVFWEYYRASFCPGRASIVSLSEERNRIEALHQCFLFFCIDIQVFALFVYGIWKDWYWYNRNYLWDRIPIISKSGLVKGHSLSRRHRQYSRYSGIKRVLRYCTFCNIMNYIILYLCFWLYEENMYYYIFRTDIEPFLYTFCVYEQSVYTVFWLYRERKHRNFPLFLRKKISSFLRRYPYTIYCVYISFLFLVLDYWRLYALSRHSEGKKP